MTSLMVKKSFGGSLIDLNRIGENEEEPRVKESKGLLRRAFSSRKKKKKKEKEQSTSSSPNYLTPNFMPNTPNKHSRSPKHQPLRIVRSNPNPELPHYYEPT